MITARVPSLRDARATSLSRMVQQLMASCHAGHRVEERPAHLLLIAPGALERSGSLVSQRLHDRGVAVAPGVLAALRGQQDHADRDAVDPHGRADRRTDEAELRPPEPDAVGLAQARLRHRRGQRRRPDHRAFGGEDAHRPGPRRARARTRGHPMPPRSWTGRLPEDFSRPSVGSLIEDHAARRLRERLATRLEDGRRDGRHVASEAQASDRVRRMRGRAASRHRSGGEPVRRRRSPAA